MKRVFLATVLCVVNAVGLCACQGHNNGASTQKYAGAGFRGYDGRLCPPKPVVP